MTQWKEIVSEDEVPKEQVVTVLMWHDMMQGYFAHDVVLTRVQDEYLWRFTKGRGHRFCEFTLWHRPSYWCAQGELSYDRSSDHLRPKNGLMPINANAEGYLRSKERLDELA